MIKPFQYKEPSERTAAFGFALSILNGNTVEGGLRLLTYKSIYASKLTEELALVRRTIVPEPVHLLRVTEAEYATPSRVAALKKEISEIRPVEVHEDESIDALNKLIDSTTNFEQITNQLSAELQQVGATLAYSILEPLPYKLHRVQHTLPVERMEDVEGFDGSIYAVKAEQHRREEEERELALQEQLRREQEELQEAEAALNGELAMSDKLFSTMGTFDDLTSVGMGMMDGLGMQMDLDMDGMDLETY